MIARVWKGMLKAGKTEEYLAHLQKNVIPELEQIPGFHGVDVWLGRDADHQVVVTTRWDSMESITRFAGADPGRAVVAPEAQKVLASYDSRVVHFDIAIERGEKRSHNRVARPF